MNNAWTHYKNREKWIWKWDRSICNSNSTSKKIKDTLLSLSPTYLPLLIPHSERLTEEHRGGLWAQKLSCGLHVAPVVILSICALEAVVKAL